MKKFYVTTSIPYVNAPPHIGFALELVQADVLARYHRSLKEDVFFLTGTDEHGAKIVKAAKDSGKSLDGFINETSDRFRFLTRALNISNNDFIRTTDTIRHWPAVKKIWLELKGKGDIYKKKYQGLYCIGCEAFYLEKDLISGKCPVHNTKLDVIDEENYFFKLSKYSRKIRKMIERNKIRIIPESRKNEVINFIDEGIEDISFSRSKERYWGFEVPDDKTQTMYVWVDALPNYISAIGFRENYKKFKKLWPADVHLIGKDIWKFHALIWPGILLSLGLDLPKTIFVHGFITVGGQKMSKSLGNVIDPFVLIEKYGADPLRYYLLREVPPTEDGDFTYEKFNERYNSDLAKGLGNLVSRIRAMADDIGFKKTKDKILESKIKEVKKNYKKALNDFKFNEALRLIWELISLSDKYIEEEKPWNRKDNSVLVLGSLLSVLDNIAELIAPFLPKTSEMILKEIERDKNSFKNKRGKALFPRI
ncbi:MAG: methionine--tRNA ligase [Candidatus Pacebacteria bacterium]|nr:methionine--tRNA ligase [Candidatus Paceibacterota bacterium]